ncbi:MAG: acyltransferase family protein [Planctomycetes bacterium]|nr:acyltransferase family protein [Planctomycetota bacterium]
MAEPSNLPSNNIAYIDSLRVTACFFVVFVHVAGGSADGYLVFSRAWWACKGLYFLCCWSIPVFVMISGALLLNRTQPSIRAFYKRRMHRIGVPLVFWTLFYLGVRVLLDHESLTVSQGLTLLFQGQAYAHLWFFYMIAGLYLITPFLQILVKHITTAQCLILVTLILVAADVFHLCNVIVWGMPPNVFTLFVPFIGYFLLGFLIHHKWPRGQLPGAWVAGGTAVSVIYLLCLAKPFIQVQSQQFGYFFFGFFGPPVAFMAIAVYWAFREICTRPLGPRLKHLASCTLGIYAAHVFILKLMQIFLAKEASRQYLWVGLVLGSVIAFALSYGLVSVLKKCPVICRIVA